MNTIFSNLLYQLKRQFGSSIDYVQLEKSEVDHDRGTRTIERVVFPLRVVQLPASLMRKFVQDIGYLAANKNFTYGGLNDLQDVSFVLDPNDLPSRLDQSLDGFIHWQGQRLEKVSFDWLLDAAIVLKVRGVKGAVPYAEVRSQTQSRLQMQGRVTYELN